MAPNLLLLKVFMTSFTVRFTTRLTIKFTARFTTRFAIRFTTKDPGAKILGGWDQDLGKKNPVGARRQTAYGKGCRRPALVFTC